MTGSKRHAGSLALAAGLVVLLACSGQTVKKASGTTEAPNGEPVAQGTGGGGLFQPVTDTPTTPPITDTTAATPPTDTTAPATGGTTDGGAPAEPPAPPPPPPPPASWPPPGSAAESIAQLAHFWAEERFDWNEDWAPIREQQELERTLLAKAEVDECFSGIGKPSGIPVDGQCAEGQQPKRNQSYVWGLTRTGRDLWFGTVANVVCQVVLGWIVPDSNVTLQNPYFVCEGQQSASGMGDFRPPHLYRHDLDTGVLSTLDPTDGVPAGLLRMTAGIRSAGEADGVVFLAGPGVRGGINVFAFDAETGDLLGAKNLPEYNDIRTWVKANGVLYAGVGNTPAEDGAEATASACLASATPCEPRPAGSVLRWTGSKADLTTLFDFEVVGVMDNEAANLAQHDDRLFVTTWPSLTADLSSAHPAGLFVSPPLGGCGLTVADAGGWRELWSVADYDPDPIARLTTAGGAIASFGGKLYWGTMSVPFLATAAAQQLQAAGQLPLDSACDGKVGPSDLLATALGTHRSVAVFTLEGTAAPTSDPADGAAAQCPTAGYRIELLFGERYLPRYDASRHMYTIVADEAHQNVAGLRPQRGSSGFGNFFNAYVWSMAVYRDSLYIGTFDWVQVARATLEGLVPAPAPSEEAPSLPVAEAPTPCLGPDGSACPEEKAKAPAQLLLEFLGERLPREGADLIRVECDGAVTAESLTGLGNDTNYGVRNMVTDGDALYVGTANAMNLHPDGGWELLELRPKHTCGDPLPVDVAQ